MLTWIIKALAHFFAPPRRVPAYVPVRLRAPRRPPRRRVIDL